MEEIKDFLNEIHLLKLLNTHPNVVKLIGYTLTTQPILMIMEFVSGGDLKNYLLELRDQWKVVSNKNYE